MKCPRLIACGVMVWLAVGTMVSLAPRWAVADSGPRLVVDVDSAVVGDGEAQTRVRLRASHGGALTGARVLASAGTVASGERDGDAWVFAYTAPRVSEDTTVTFAAFARVGRRPLRAQATLQVTAVRPVARRVRGRGPLSLMYPAWLATGEHTVMEFSIPGEEQSGAPRAANMPIVAVNRGHVAAVEAVGDHWRVRYTSADGYPYFAVLAVASADGAHVDWAVIPVLATPTIEVVTEPHARIDLRVGGERHGPFSAGRSGTLQIAVRVKPGIEEALVTGVDRVGNSITQTLPLAPPPYPRMALLCPATGARNLLVAVDSDGDSDGVPHKGAQFRLRTSLGEAGALVAKQPGVFEFALQGAFPGNGMVEIDAYMSDVDMNEQRTSCVRPPPAQLPTAVRLALSQSDFRPGDGPIEVGIGGEFAPDGRPVDIVPTLTVSRGRLGPVRRVERGRYAVTWSLPDTHEGEVEAGISATLGTVSAKRVVRLKPGPVAAMHLVRRGPAPSAPLMANGRAQVPLGVRVVDEYGNPVSGMALSARATAGTLGPFVEGGGGQYRAIYTVPESHDPVRETVTVTGSTMAGLSVEAAVGFDVAALPRRRAVAARVGGFVNFGRLMGFALMAEVVHARPFWCCVAEVGVQGGVLYGDGGMDGEASSGAVHTSARSVPMLAKVSLRQRWGAWMASAGVGAGALWSKVWIRSDDIGTAVDDAIRPSAMASLAAGWAISRGRIGLDIAYIYADLNERIAIGNPAGLVITAGYRLGF